MSNNKSVERVDLKSLLSTAMGKLAEKDEKMRKDLLAESATFNVKLDEDLAAHQSQLWKDWTALKDKFCAEIQALEKCQDIPGLRAKKEEADKEFIAFEAKIDEERAVLQTKQVDDAWEMITRWVQASALDVEEKDIFKEMMAVWCEIDAFNSKKKEEMVAFNARWEIIAAALRVKHSEEIKNISALTGKNRRKRVALEAKHKEDFVTFKTKKNEYFVAFCAKKNEEYAALLAKEKRFEAESAALAAVKAKEEELLKEIAALKVQNTALDAKKEAILKECAALQAERSAVQEYHPPAADDSHQFPYH